MFGLFTPQTMDERREKLRIKVERAAALKYQMIDELQEIREDEGSCLNCRLFFAKPKLWIANWKYNAALKKYFSHLASTYSS